MMSPFWRRGCVLRHPAKPYKQQGFTVIRKVTKTSHQLDENKWSACWNYLIFCVFKSSLWLDVAAYVDMSYSQTNGSVWQTVKFHHVWSILIWFDFEIVWFFCCSFKFNVEVQIIVKITENLQYNSGHDLIHTIKLSGFVRIFYYIVYIVLGEVNLLVVRPVLDDLVGKLDRQMFTLNLYRHSV